MIMDDRLEFMDNAALTTGVATTLQGDVIDITTTRDWGMGEQMYLVIQVTTAVTSDGSATLQFKLLSDSTAVIAVDGSATQHAATAATLAKTVFTAGKRFIFPIGVGTTFERFVGITLTTATAALTAGKIDAFLTKDPVGWTAYADATN